MIPTAETLTSANGIIRQIESLQAELAALFGSDAKPTSKRRARPPGSGRKMNRGGRRAGESTSSDHEPGGPRQDRRCAEGALGQVPCGTEEGTVGTGYERSSA